jgi:hypothetical protein
LVDSYIKGHEWWPVSVLSLPKRADGSSFSLEYIHTMYESQNTTCLHFTTHDWCVEGLGIYLYMIPVVSNTYIEWLNENTQITLLILIHRRIYDI